MFRSVTFAVLLTSAAGLFASQQANTTVTVSARLTIVREPTTDLLVHITNLRSAPLAHYAVRVGNNTISWHRSITSPGNLPIRTGQRQSHRIAVADADSVRPQIVLLGFSDGYFEGERDVLQRHFLDYGTPAGSSISDTRPTFVDGRSATITAVPVPGERVVEVLENLRRVPIEAWTISYPGDGEPGNRSAVRMDTCSGHAMAPGQGAIAPGTSRRVIRSPPQEIGAPVKAELRMVFFADGYFEGDRGEVDEVLASRKARALTCGRYH